MTTSAKPKIANFFRGMAFAVLLFFLGSSSGCAPGVTEHYFTGSTMGTTYHIKAVVDLDAEARDKLQTKIDAALANIVALMSSYEPDSEVTRFNKRPSLETFPISPETVEVLSIAQTVGEQSKGAFDLTVASLVDAWGFGTEPSSTVPDPAVIDALRERVGLDMLVLDETERTLQKRNPDAAIDVSAVAKGYAVDRVADVLERAGIDRYMVEVGGELRARGTNHNGVPWRIAIELPVVGVRDVHDVIGLRNLAMATSGDYRNFFETDSGIRYSHAIDPRTGAPVTHNLASATVLHESCAWADAYATAILVLGPEAGLALANEHELAALLISREPDGAFTITQSEHWAPATAEDESE